MDHSLEFLGDDSLRRIGPQLGGRLVEQRQQFDLIEPRFGRVAIADIDDNAYARAIDRRIAFEAQPVIAGFVTDRVDLKRTGIERDTVVTLNFTNFLEETARQLRIALTKSEQVEITGRPVWIVEPMAQQHRT